MKGGQKMHKKLDLLYKYHNMAYHNLLCYSKNYAMTEVKEGFETEWKQAKEECELLEEMISSQKMEGKKTAAQDEQLFIQKKDFIKSLTRIQINLLEGLLHEFPQVATEDPEIFEELEGLKAEIATL
jgi:hypothetical protein